MAGELKQMLADLANTDERINDEVKRLLVDDYVFETASNRVSAIRKAMNVFKDIQGRIKNLEEKDVKFYDDVGAIVLAYYSQQRSYRLKSTRAAAITLRAALDAAIAGGSIDALRAAHKSALSIACKREKW